MKAAEDPRATLAELVAQVEKHFGDRLLGLYLFGSLATGDFYPGRSDLDLIAVLETAVTDGEDLDGLRELHERFERERPDWCNRIEVLYVSSEVLATLVATPTGTVARISPGEPLHVRELEGNVGWRLDWHAALTAGETLLGPPPFGLGPEISPTAFREAVLAQLRDLQDDVRDPTVAWAPARQGYIVATVARALYALETGRETSKEEAIAWVAERYPGSAELVWNAYRAYRSDVHAIHEQVIDFVDQAAQDASKA